MRERSCRTGVMVESAACAVCAVCAVRSMMFPIGTTITFGAGGIGFLGRACFCSNQVQV